MLMGADTILYLRRLALICVFMITNFIFNTALIIIYLVAETSNIIGLRNSSSIPGMTPNNSLSGSGSISPVI